MNKRKTYSIIIILVLFAVAILSSCRDDKHKEHDPIPVKREISLTLEPGKWIYYSISDSTVVGRSDMGDSQQDSEWGERLDWDIAFSESGIRTNSGTSGRGNGGLALISDSLYDIESPFPLMTLDYTVDTLGVNAIRPVIE